MGLRYAIHRVDANAAEIIHAMECAGASVERLGRPVDVAVGVDGQEALAEIKTITGRLRPSQERFWQRWKGQKVVLRTMADGVALVERLRSQARILKAVGGR